MFWRLIDDGPHDAVYNMALDEAISYAVREKHSPATLRLYLWSAPAVSIGYFQKSSDIDLDYCRLKNYAVVRRLTGGSGIFHDSELTYSFSARSDFEPFAKGLIKDYFAIADALSLALKLLEVDARINFTRRGGKKHPVCFRMSSYGEISVEGRKVVGSAQKRYRNGFLQQGSILLDSDAAEVEKVFGKYGSGDGLCEIGAVRRYAPGLEAGDLRKALQEAFETRFKITLAASGPSAFEAGLVEKLTAEKYSTGEWNFMR